MDCSPPGSSAHGILQARTLKWMAIPFCKGSSWPRGQTQVSCIAESFFTIWATGEAHVVSAQVHRFVWRGRSLCIIRWALPVKLFYLSPGVQPVNFQFSNFHFPLTFTCYLPTLVGRYHPSPVGCSVETKANYFLTMKTKKKVTTGDSTPNTYTCTHNLDSQRVELQLNYFTSKLLPMLKSTSIYLKSFWVMCGKLEC